MSRININDIEKFEQTGGDTNFFNSLKDDKDTAVIRLLHSDVDDLDIHAVHRVEVTNKDGKTINRYVGCLAPEGKPCPLCNSGNFRLIKIYLHLIHEGQYKIWERGKTMIRKIEGLFPRYGRDVNGLYGREFEVQRNGGKGDPKTSYEFYPLDKDGKTIEDFKDEKKDVEGTLILEWDANTMTDFLNGVDVYNKESSVTDEEIVPRVQTGREVF